MQILTLVLIALGIWAIYHFIIKKFKAPKVGALGIVNGGVKTGKSTLAVHLTKSIYKQNARRIKIKNKIIDLINKIFRKNKEKIKHSEEPLIYSNIPLAVPYVPLTKEILLRQERPRYKSVIYINEASLLADSRTLDDEAVNIQLLLMFKLIGHSTKGGCIILDTHTVGDLHISEKRTASEYFYIHHLTKWIPFFLLAHVQECRYSNDNSTIFTQNEDIEEKLKKVIIPKKVWKDFDAYSYSALTDDLPIAENVITGQTDLKARNIVTFNTKLEKYLKINQKEIEKKAKEKIKDFAFKGKENEK